MRAEYVIFYGLYAIATLFILVGLIVWRRNLGPTSQRSEKSMVASLGL